jgi:nucleoside-diphosphate-sugar epimerase
MVVVAVAGGTGAVGRNIVEALVSQGKHEVIVLSRKVCRIFLGFPQPS